MFTKCFHRNPNKKWIQNVHKFKWTLQKYLPSNSSGGLYHNVTTLFVYLLGWPFLLMLIALARPKSASFKIPCLVIKTLAAFISRWIILLLEEKNILWFKEYMFLLAGNIMPGAEKLWGELFQYSVLRQKTQCAETKNTVCWDK